MLINNMEPAQWALDAQQKFDEFSVPPHVRAGLRRWVLEHLVPGDFLCAVLRNDLRAACLLADDCNKPRLWNIVAWLYNTAPATCWGSPDRFEAWAVARYAVAGRKMEGE